MNYIHKHITRLVFLLTLTLGTFIGKGQTCYIDLSVDYIVDSTGLYIKIKLSGSGYNVPNCKIPFVMSNCQLYSAQKPIFILDSLYTSVTDPYVSNLIFNCTSGTGNATGEIDLTRTTAGIVIPPTPTLLGTIHFPSVTGTVADNFDFFFSGFSPVDSSNSFDTTFITSCAVSNYTFGYIGSAPLPVKLTSFNGKLETDEVKLNWSTATETNNDYFEVERSLDGKSFTKIGFVKGAGNSVNVQKYVYIDISADNEVLYYRLKQVDYDGTFSYSNIVVVKQNKSSVKLYPNPFENHVTIYGHGDIVITDILGKIYFSGTVGNVQTTDWPTGVYLVQYMINGEVKKIVKN